MDERRARFERIYDENYERILGYALRRTDTAEDAADAVAETFVAAWRRLDDVPDGPRARLWLYGTARKVLGNQFRAARRRRSLADRLHAAMPRVVDEVMPVADTTLGTSISAAFARLGDQDRELLLMVAWEELEPGEIATVLGCAPGTARVRLHRARKRFARALQIEGVQRSARFGHKPVRWAMAHPDMEETR